MWGRSNNLVYGKPEDIAVPRTKASSPRYWLLLGGVGEEQAMEEGKMEEGGRGRGRGKGDGGGGERVGEERVGGREEGGEQRRRGGE